MAKITSTLLILASCGISLAAQTVDQVYKAAGTPADPKVSVAWDRYYDAGAVAQLCKKIADAHPALAKAEVIGKSGQGRDLWCLAITDFSKGEANRKPAEYLQGNIHGNEIQGTEFALYMAWYLTESFADVPAIRSLLARKVFYIVPTVNPDGRDDFIHHPNTPNTPRGAPGALDQKGLQDLDGDGNITFERRHNPNGVWRKDPAFPNEMIPLPEGDTFVPGGPDASGAAAKARQPNAENYDLMLEGGVDARRPLTVPQEIDPNRDWLWSWDKNERFPREPFRFPENRAARDFILKHPNIAVAIDMHNDFKAFISATFQGNDTVRDLETFDLIMKHGQELIPGFETRSKFAAVRLARHAELSLRGEQINWMFGRQGIYSFILELAGRFDVHEQIEGGAGQWFSKLSAYNEELLLGDGFVPWHEVTDPELGQVEVGGWKKNAQRLEPGFLIESHAHRAMAFAVYCAKEMPSLSVRTLKVEEKGEGRREITVAIANAGLISTHSDVDLAKAITRPDSITLTTHGKVLSVQRFDTISLQTYEQAGPDEKMKERTVVAEQADHPGAYEIPDIPGSAVVIVRWLVLGGGDDETVTVDSVKGGYLSVPVAIANNSTERPGEEMVRH